ncbi:arylsulfatase, partial [Rubripirellula sp.]|nr:arylsulfatase [Rubripirellula sp.]
MQLACLTDFYSTVASITKIDHASGGEDSHSWLPIFTGQGNYTRQSLVSHSIGGSFAIREGDWKLCLSAG